MHAVVQEFHVSFCRLYHREPLVSLHLESRVIGKQAALNRIVLIISLSATLSCAVSRAHASELYEAVVEILKEDAIDIDMTYCQKISYRGADSVYAIVSSEKNKIWLAGIEYPERSKVRAFLLLIQIPQRMIREISESCHAKGILSSLNERGLVRRYGLLNISNGMVSTLHIRKHIERLTPKINRE